MTQQDVEISLDLIQKKLDEYADIAAPVMIMEKIASLSSLIGLSSECCAWAEGIYSQKIGELVLNKHYKNLSATDKKMLFASEAANEIRAYTRAERLNKGISHSLDGLRSLLSYLKEDYRQSHG